MLQDPAKHERSNFNFLLTRTIKDVWPLVTTKPYEADTLFVKTLKNVEPD
jgi:hypothetical protein